MNFSISLCIKLGLTRLFDQWFQCDRFRAKKSFFFKLCRSKGFGTQILKLDFFFQKYLFFLHYGSRFILADLSLLVVHLILRPEFVDVNGVATWKLKKATELILMLKASYTFKELKSKISILFSFLSKYWKLENKPCYLPYVRTVGSWSNSRAWFLILGQNSEVKLMPNESSRLILKGSLFKPSGISPSANQR